MSPSLVIYILAVGSLLCSLASFPEMTNLALEESPISKYLPAFSMSPPVTNLRTSLSSLAEATEYLSIVDYADSLCKTPITVGFALLNSCQQTDTSGYSYYTATSSSFSGGLYSDSQCKVALDVPEISYTPGACSNKSIITVSSTNKWTTDLSTVQVR